MADVFSKEKRSQVMSRIRSRGNRKTEIALLNLMRTNGIAGWRRHYPILGKPDFVFKGLRLAIFVDGCFWHRCPRCALNPATNRKFWEAKLAANRERDRTVNRLLRQQGWRVLRIWEHSLKRPGAVLRRLLSALGSG